MKALSVRQPWAWAMFQPNPKDIENRDWSTKIRGRIAIHASKSNRCVLEDEIYSYHSLIREINERHGLNLTLPTESDLVLGAIIGTVEIVDCVDESASPWFQGDFGFVLQKPLALPTPIACRGALGFWNVPEEIEAKLSLL